MFIILSLKFNLKDGILPSMLTYTLLLTSSMESAEKFMYNEVTLQEINIFRYCYSVYRTYVYFATILAAS